MPTMSQYWSVFWQCRKMHLMQLLEYRGNFFFWSFVSVMWTGFNLLFVNLMANVTGSIAGWSPTELRLLVGIYTMIDAFTWSFFYHNMTTYTRHIFDGTLGQILIKPIDSQFMIMTQNNSYTNVFRFLIGLVLTVYSLIELGWKFNILQLLLAIVVILASMLVVYCLWFMMSTLAFYVERLENINEVIPALRSTYEFPRQIYRGLIANFFTFVIPVGLLTSVPAELLLGKVPWFLIGYVIIFSLVIFLVARWFFQVSVKRFSGVAN